MKRMWKWEGMLGNAKKRVARIVLHATMVFWIAPVLTCASAYAADQDIHYGIRMPYRIVRGFTNLGLGWPEIFLRPIGEHRTESVIEAAGMGAANTLIRFGVGVIDITTFWVPDIQMEELYPDWQVWPYLFHWS